MRKLFYSILVGTATMTASGASAAVTLGSTTCSLGDISPTAVACRGWYEGNLNSNSPADRAAQAAALNALLGVSTFTAANLTFTETLPSISGNSVNFATPLYGNTVVSFHVGGANGQATGIGYSGTAFYLFDAGNLVGGLDTIGFNRAGLSNARLYSTGTFQTPAVPEPATWLMMILGFAAVGGAMRRKQAVQARVRYA
ncbi:PEPxxWA-CTERM sorting domain-containing protein [Porphyrobacter sp. GA68]|uniref:PEPxxWA-CTERM sorting domain-containing protein n=1 Tax=Porphyrobacter sp. GA68 TaxID=2883480 RepID=UPI001D17FB6D|nr:PEPxxWA-CTERM sorting domain-containing protein [Porphyrobacter sp. GA68]